MSSTHETWRVDTKKRAVLCVCAMMSASGRCAMTLVLVGPPSAFARRAMARRTLHLRNNGDPFAVAQTRGAGHDHLFACLDAAGDLNAVAGDGAGCDGAQPRLQIRGLAVDHEHRVSVFLGAVLDDRGERHRGCRRGRSDLL